MTLRVSDAGTLFEDQSFTVTVANVNDAPVLDNTLDSQGNTADLSLSAIEDAGAPFGPVGTLISDLVAIGGNVTDVDDSAVTGVALTTLTTDNGSWHYTLNGGISWTAAGSVADDNALLLAADANTRLYFQPNASFNGSITDAITLRAWDQSSGTAGTQVDTSTNGGTTAFSSAIDTANMTITAVNDAPVNSLPTTAPSVDEDTALTFTGTELISISDDAGENPVKVALTAFNGTLTLNGTTDLTFATDGGDGDADAKMEFTGKIADINTALDGMIFTPTANYSGPASVRIVTDDQGNTGSGGALSDDDIVDISVNAVNDEPTFTSTAVTFVNEDSAYGYNIATRDIDTGDTLTITAPTKPSWLSLADKGDGSGTLSGTPTTFDVGTHDVTLRVSDGTEQAEQSFTVTVFKINDAPVFTSTAITSVNEDTAYSYSIATSDADAGDTLTITASTNPSWLTLTDNGDGTGTLSGTPTIAEVGTHNVTLQVSDGTAQTEQSFTVTVIKINDAPVFTSTAVTAVDKDSAYNYSIVTSDADGDSLTITAPTTPSWLSLADNGDGTGTLSGTPTDSEVGTHNVTLRVSDGSEQADQSFTVTVSRPNKAPVNTVPGAQNVAQDSALIFSAANDNLLAISDEDAGANVVAVTLTATNGTLTLSGTENLTFTAGDGTDDASMAFTGTITDINTALDGISFKPTAGFLEQASLQIVTNDQGHTGTGGPQSDDDTVIINVKESSVPVPLELTLTVEQASFSEAFGTPSTATVTRLDTSGVLTVTLSSSDTTEVTVPPTVEIPDAQTSVSFNINAVDDNVVDGTQTVTLTASATGYTEATTTVSITDNDVLPPSPPVTPPAPQPKLTVEKDGEGTVTSEPKGIDCGDDCSETYNSGTKVTLTATPEAGWALKDWEGHCQSTGGSDTTNNNTAAVTMNANKTCQANFVPTLTVEKVGEGTVTSEPEGIDCGEDCSEAYDKDTEVTLTATPEAGWALKAWEGDCQSTDSDTTSNTTVAVTMDTNKTCKASFATLSTTLTVETDGDGTVTSEPTGIDCGEDCSEAYDKDTEVTLTATPEAGWALKGWEGDCQSTDSDTTNTVAVTMDTDKTCKASFVFMPITLTVDKVGEGTITSEPESINCGTDCSAEFAEQTALTLTAAPAAGYWFRGWTGDCNKGKNSENPITVNLDAVFKCKAHFAKQSLCPANGFAIDAQDMSTLEQPANSPSCFAPQISVGGADVSTAQPNHAALVSSVATAVNLSGTLTVAPEDIGKPADILMVGMYSTLAGELGKANWEWPLGEHFIPQITGALYTRAGETWIFWDGQLSSIPSAEKVSQLPETLEVPVFEGDLSAAPGEFFAYLGYRLEDDTIHYNGVEPLHFSVGNAASVDTRNSSTLNFTNNEVQATSYFQPFVRNSQGQVGNHLTVMESDTLEVSSLIRVDSRHVGQAAEILITATYQPHFGSQVTYTRNGDFWEIWDGQLDSLPSAKYYSELPNTQEVSVYQGSLTGMPGNWIVTVGYRLNGGVLVFNGLEPIYVTVVAVPQ